ncbi:MAG: hypothetical protein OER12_01965 [Acidimicrobiia bacterium]|nr:hypothetical protein [Acidimicrobiia bacterium]
MRQYGRAWWALVLLVGAVLAVLIATSPRARLVDPQAVGEPPPNPISTPRCCDPILGADVTLLRAELAALSRDEFIVTDFLTRRLEIRVLTEEQEEFIRQVIGPTVDEFVDVVVGDLGLTIPDEPPSSMYALTPEEKTEARQTLIRIIENEEGGGWHVRIMPETGQVRVAFEDDSYIELARRFFGPDVHVQNWFPPGQIGFGWPPYGFPGQNTAFSVARVLAAGLLFGLVAAAVRQLLGTAPRPAIAWWVAGAGVTLAWLSGFADEIGRGHRGFGFVQVAGVAAGLGMALAAVITLSRLRFDGWRRALAIMSLPALALVGAAHGGWLVSQPTQVVVGTVTVASPVTALPRPEPTEIASLVSAEVAVLGWRRAWYVREDQEPLERIDANVIRSTYPLTWEVRYYGNDAEALLDRATERHARHVSNLQETSLAEPRGAASGSVSQAALPVGPSMARVISGYLAAAFLILLVIPRSWWRKGDEAKLEPAPPAPHEPMLTGAGV